MKPAKTSPFPEKATRRDAGEKGSNPRPSRRPSLRAIPSPSKKLSENEIVSRVNSRIEVLPEEQEQIIRLNIIENLSLQQIAATKGLPLDKVTEILNQALRSLRQRPPLPN